MILIHRRAVLKTSLMKSKASHAPWTDNFPGVINDSHSRVTTTTTTTRNPSLEVALTTLSNIFFLKLIRDFGDSAMLLKLECNDR